MYSLHAFADPGQVDEAVAALREQAEVRHVMLGGITADTGKTLIRAEIGAESVDDTFAALQQIGIAAADLSVSRIDFARPMTADGVVEDAVDDQDSLVWAEVADAAAENVSLRPSYLAYMIVAGVIAAFGVTERSTILIVGAMAVSPDLLPMSAACVALVARRPRLMGRAFGTLRARPRPGRACRLPADARPATCGPGVAADGHPAGSDRRAGHRQRRHRRRGPGRRRRRDAAPSRPGRASSSASPSR